MPNNYRLSPLAQADLESIWLFTRERWSIDQADTYYNDILTALGELASGKRAGRKVTVREGYLKCPVGAHFVFFKLSRSGIHVVRILHQRMNIEKHL